RQATIAVTARAAQTEVDLAAERAAVVVVRRDRDQRLRQLAAGPLPLLADVGAGRLDPSDPAVRRECAATASALRRTLSRDDAPTGLLAALEPAILAVEQRGALLEVQVGADLRGLAGDLVTRVVDATSQILS
nr:hypothetical protein [Micromonospora sp. DSM 115978]